MRYHSQNLNDDGSMLWHGRSWLHLGEPYRSRSLHAEWSFGLGARFCDATIAFGNGDDDRGILVHLAIPFIFSVYLGISGVFRCRECSIGVAIHNDAIWLYTLSLRMDSPRPDDPWWRETHSWSFPWTWCWHHTKTLDFDGKVVYLEKIKIVSKDWDSQQAIRKSVSREFDYTYKLKSGEIQNRKAMVYVDRMTWRAKWWPIIPLEKSRTCINVTFNDEVGENTGRWKGGCIGCGYTMLPGEAPLDTLRRMERERKF